MDIQIINNINKYNLSIKHITFDYSSNNITILLDKNEFNTYLLSYTPLFNANLTSFTKFDINYINNKAKQCWYFYNCLIVTYTDMLSDVSIDIHYEFNVIDINKIKEIRKEKLDLIFNE